MIRAARDGLGLDLQKLVHEDMVKDFDAYPARKAWGSRRPDANIDHRRVLNLEAYWIRAGARLWAAGAPTPGDAFPKPVLVGDIVTWLLDARLPHVGIVVSTALALTTVVHNIGNGAEETALSAFHPHLAAGHFRWPVQAGPFASANDRFSGPGAENAAAANCALPASLLTTAMGLRAGASRYTSRTQLE